MEEFSNKIQIMQSGRYAEIDVERQFLRSYCHLFEKNFLDMVYESFFYQISCVCRFSFGQGLGSETHTYMSKYKKNPYVRVTWI